MKHPAVKSCNHNHQAAEGGTVRGTGSMDNDAMHISVDRQEGCHFGDRTLHASVMPLRNRLFLVACVSRSTNDRFRPPHRSLVQHA